MSPHHRPSKSPKLEFKMDTKNHEKKDILILQRVNFCFQNTRQIKGLHILNDACWLFDQKA
jgi:hypothetical protein